LAHTHLKNSGVSIIQAPDDGMSMLVADPDNLVIEIWQKEEENDDSGDNFGAFARKP